MTASPILPDAAGGPLRHAAQRLTEDLGASPADGSAPVGVRVLIDPTASSLEAQGYRFQTPPGGPLVITGQTEAGATNGVHAVRRQVLLSGQRMQATLPRMADGEHVPSFARRTMLVAPYSFGGQQGRSVLGVETWGIDRWREYIDLLRLLNANALALFPLRLWHPDFPDTFLEKARYDVWKKVMGLCHDVGIEFHWVMLPNQVPDGFLDARPELAVEGNDGWQGTAVAWHKLAQGAANELILLQEPTYDHFRDADAFVYMWNDGGASDLSRSTFKDPVTPLVEMMAFARERIEAAGSRARAIFWGWLLEPWYPLFASSAVPEFPPLQTFAQDARAALDSGLGWLQESGRQYEVLGLPGYTDPLKAAHHAGFQEVTDFYYHSHPETATQVLPHPLIDDARAEVAHARERRATGFCGYRLSPASRFLNDWVILRLAEDATLKREILIDELAAFVAEGDPDLIPPVREAIEHLEAWRPGVGPPVRDHPGIYVAAMKLESVTGPTSPRRLQNLDALVSFTALSEILNIESLPPAEEQMRFRQLIELCKQQPILRAFSIQPQWAAERDLQLREFIARLARPGSGASSALQI